MCENSRRVEKSTLHLDIHLGTKERRNEGELCVLRRNKWVNNAKRTYKLHSQKIILLHVCQPINTFSIKIYGSITRFQWKARGWRASNIIIHIVMWSESSVPVLMVAKAIQLCSRIGKFGLVWFMNINIVIFIGDTLCLLCWLRLRGWVVIVGS